MIVADSNIDFLTADSPTVATGQLVLCRLVFRSQEYARNRGYYGDACQKIKDAIVAGRAVGASEDAKAIVRALSAVANKLRTLPGLRAESEGSDKRRTFVSIPDNWEELALDVLYSLYLPVGDGSGGSASFIIAERGLRVECDRRANNDELYRYVNGEIVRMF